MVTKNKLSLIVPLYNESSFLWSEANRLINYLKELKELSDFEIILIDNASTDNTLEVAKKIKRNNSKVKVVINNKKGLGEALKSGLKKAKYTSIFWAIDNPFGYKILNETLNKTNEGFDLVVWSKGHKNSKIKVPIKRRVFTKLISLFIKMMYHQNIGDTQGTFAIKKELFNKIKKHLTSKRPWFQTQLIVYSLKKNAHSVELPVKYDYSFSRPSRFKIWDALIFVYDMIKEYYYFY